VRKTTTVGTLARLHRTTFGSFSSPLNSGSATTCSSLHRSDDAKLAFVRGGSPPSLDGSVGLLFRVTQGVRRGIVKTDVPTTSPPASHGVGSEGRRSNGRSRGRSAGSRQLTGNEWNTTADKQPFTVRQSFPTSRRFPIRIAFPEGRVPFPFTTPHGPGSLAGRGIRAVAGSSGVTLPANVTVREKLAAAQRERRRNIGAFARHFAAAVETTIRFPGCRKSRETSRAAAYLPGTIGAAHVILSISAATTTAQLSARAVARTCPCKAYYSLAAATKMSISGRAGCRGVQKRDQGLATNEVGIRNDRTQLSLSGVGGRTTCRARPYAMSI